MILERLYTSNLLYKYIDIFIKPTQMRRNSSIYSITKNPNNYIRKGNLKLTKVLELLCKTPMSGQTLQNVFNKHAFILVLVKDIERKKPFLFSRMILIASCNLVWWISIRDELLNPAVTVIHVLFKICFWQVLTIADRAKHVNATDIGSSFNDLCQ